MPRLLFFREFNSPSPSHSTSSFRPFTFGLAAWLTVLEAVYLKTDRQIYRVDKRSLPFSQLLPGMQGPDGSSRMLLFFCSTGPQAFFRPVPLT